MRAGPKSGFTLVEVLTVTGIIAILAAMIFPVLTNAKHRGQLTACTSNLRQIGMAFVMYCADNSDTMPPPTRDQYDALNCHIMYVQVIWPYLRQGDRAWKGYGKTFNSIFFHCPRDSSVPALSAFPLVKTTWQWFGTSYYYNSVRRLSDGVYAVSAIPGSRIAQLCPGSRLVLVYEASAMYPISWHEPSSGGSGVYMRGDVIWGDPDSRSCLLFVDGHVRYSPIYFDLDKEELAIVNNPPPDYGYMWNPH